jgi:hypothetical protein
LTSIFAARENCVTHAGHITGIVILCVILLMLLTCAVGWSRALSRAHRAEGALEVLRHSGQG